MYKVNDGFIHVDINYCEDQYWAYGLLHHTGDMQFNIVIRRFAKQHGYKLNQYGLWRLKTEKRVPNTKFKTEREIFKFLGFKYHTPAERSLRSRFVKKK
jgi:DNA polymerase (family 10)